MMNLRTINIAKQCTNSQISVVIHTNELTDTEESELSIFISSLKIENHSSYQRTKISDRLKEYKFRRHQYYNNINKHVSENIQKVLELEGYCNGVYHYNNIVRYYNVLDLRPNATTPVMVPIWGTQSWVNKYTETVGRWKDLVYEYRFEGKSIWIGPLLVCKIFNMIMRNRVELFHQLQKSVHSSFCFLRKRESDIYAELAPNKTFCVTSNELDNRYGDAQDLHDIGLNTWLKERIDSGVLYISSEKPEGVSKTDINIYDGQPLIKYGSGNITVSCDAFILNGDNNYLRKRGTVIRFSIFDLLEGKADNDTCFYDVFSGVSSCGITITYHGKEDS